MTVYEEVDGVQRESVLALEGISFCLEVQRSKLGAVAGKRMQ